MKLRFTKMHGLGNDFVVIDETRAGACTDGLRAPLDRELAQKICDRLHGIGADQILHLKDSDAADARMEIWNADGSTSEMCGNGIRAAALLLKENLNLTGTSMTIETRNEAHGIRFLRDNIVEANMGEPELADTPETLQFKDRVVEFFWVGMGNPHAVIFVDDFHNLEPRIWGPRIERNPRFPLRTNVEFARPDGVQALEVRVWERGAGLTLACGSGACASAVAAIVTKRAQSPVEIRLPGGNLEIRWEGPGKDLFMTGPAEKVFEGELDL